MKNKYPFTEDEIRTAYSTSIIDIVQQYGYELEDQKKVFKVKGMGGLFIWADGLGWYHHTDDAKGNNVDFLCKYCGIKSKGDAIRLLLDYVHVIPSFQSHPKDPSPEKIKKPFVLPEINKGHNNFSRMIAYLCNSRHIDREIVNRMIAEKKLYEDIRHNCVFVGYNKEHEAKYATVRSSISKEYLPPGATPFKGDVEGSEKYPFIIKGRNPERVFVFEAPIEAMSHATIAKLAGKDYTEDTRISIGGCTTSKALIYYLECCPSTKQIILCLNNDYDKINHLTGEIDNYGQKATIRLARQFSEKGYDIKKCLPKMPYTDWNEQLCGYYRTAAQENVLVTAQNSVQNAENFPAEPEPPLEL